MAETVTLSTALKEILPEADSALNQHMSDVIGNKTDTIAGNSLAALIKKITATTTPTVLHHEKVYPYNSAGVTVTPGNMAWGNTFRLIPMDGITDDYGWDGGDISAYTLTGLTIMLDAGASKPNTYQLMRIAKSTVQALTGNAAAAQRVIPIADTSDYAKDDIVWITDGNTLDGEVGKIASIIANTSITLEGNLDNDYTTAQTAKVYLARRAGNSAFRCIWGKFAHANTKTVVRFNFHAARLLEAGDGIIIRAYGIEDANGVMLVTAIYDDVAV